MGGGRVHGLDVLGGIQMSHFAPMFPKEHAMANAGLDVPEACLDGRG